MQEETKEEYLARLKRKGDSELTNETIEEELLQSPNGLKAKLKALFFILLLALFFWAILQIFGMLKSN